jgi:acetylornithine deacetylase/succinyl-diaminopimelate desuccinylase-like protein
VATAGKLQVFPNCTNVIPEKVIFSVEVRDKEDKVIDALMEEIIEAILEECERRLVGMSVREVAKNKAILLPDSMVKRMTELADLRGLDFQVMGSGAVHDASMMAQFVDTGMIFVPSIGGRSHVKEEDTKEADLIAGANLLLDVILSLLEK